MMTIYILLNIYTNNLFADSDARSMTPSRNTRSCTLRSVPSSPGRSFFLFGFLWWSSIFQHPGNREMSNWQGVDWPVLNEHSQWLAQMYSIQLTRGWLPLTDREEVSLFYFPKCKVYNAHWQPRQGVTSDWPGRSLPPRLFFSLTAKKACNVVFNPPSYKPSCQWGYRPPPTHFGKICQHFENMEILANFSKYGDFGKSVHFIPQK